MAYRAVRCLIPELCEKVHLELWQLADRAEMTRSQLSDYISMRRVPGIENAVTIAAALKCHAEELYEWEQVPKDTRKRGKGTRNE